MYRLLGGVFREHELILGYQPLIAQIQEMVQDLDLRSLCDPRITGELSIAIFSEAFGDIARPRANGVVQLRVKPKFRLYVWPFEKHVDTNLEVARVLPRGDFSEVLPASHLGSDSKATASVIR